VRTEFDIYVFIINNDRKYHVVSSMIRNSNMTSFKRFYHVFFPKRKCSWEIKLCLINFHLHLNRFECTLLKK
jgi:hypothetical protein